MYTYRRKRVRHYILQITSAVYPLHYILQIPSVVYPLHYITSYRYHLMYTHCIKLHCILQIPPVVYLLHYVTSYNITSYIYHLLYTVYTLLVKLYPPIGWDITSFCIPGEIVVQDHRRVMGIPTPAWWNYIHPLVETLHPSEIVVQGDRRVMGEFERH